MTRWQAIKVRTISPLAIAVSLAVLLGSCQSGADPDTLQFQFDGSVNIAVPRPCLEDEADNHEYMAQTRRDGWNVECWHITTQGSGMTPEWFQALAFHFKELRLAGYPGVPLDPGTVDFEDCSSPDRPLVIQGGCTLFYSLEDHIISELRMTYSTLVGAESLNQLREVHGPPADFGIFELSDTEFETYFSLLWR